MKTLHSLALPLTLTKTQVSAKIHDANGEYVTVIDVIEHAAYIVKCVNEREQLVKALKKARTIIWNTKYHDDIEWGSTLKEASEFADECHEIVEIDEILALVEGISND